MDTSLSREIALMRGEKAIRMLLQTDAKISEIGDPASFARSFRRWTGMSPKEYRQKHRA